MVAHENRLPRETFSRKLKVMCKKLDEKSKSVFEHRYYEDRVATSHVEVKNLWVFGSYARGAPDCGDLDLIIEYHVSDGRTPSTRATTREFVGKPVRVSFYSGTPKRNESGVSLDDAVLIWSADADIWKEAIESIQVVEGATRFSRKTDIIPLRPKQLGMIQDEMLEIVKLIENGYLASTFIPFEGKMEEDLAAKKALPEVFKNYETAKNNAKAIPDIVRILESIGPKEEWRLEYSRGLMYGGTSIQIGKKNPNIERLMRSGFYAVAIVPTPTQWGPNGIWMLERGPNHPDIVKINERKIFMVFEDEKPEYINEWDDFIETKTLEVFTSKEGAEEYLKLWIEDGLDYKSEVAEIIGPKSLSYFAAAEKVYVDGVDFDMRSIGGRTCATIGDLIDSLAAI